MGYNSIEDILFVWIHPLWIAGIIWYFKRRNINKRSILKFLSIACIIVSFIMPGIRYTIRKTISFTSLNQATSFFGGNAGSGNPIIGKETALVPQIYDGEVKMNIYAKRQEKWMIPDFFIPEGQSGGRFDENIWEYTASVIPDRNSGGYYVILEDATEQYSRERGIEDSEKSEFTYFGAHITKDKGCGVYYTYLNEIPEEYEMFIDGYKIQVEWDELFPKEQ